MGGCLIVEAADFRKMTTYLPCPPNFSEFERNVRTWLGLKTDTVTQQRHQLVFDNVSCTTGRTVSHAARAQALTLTVNAGGGESLAPETYCRLQSESTITVQWQASEGTPDTRRKARHDLFSGDSATPETCLQPLPFICIAH